MAKGAAWTVLMRFGIRGIGLVSTIILARLLVPEDFGLVALATVLAAGLAVFSEFSFDVALIQNQNAKRVDYNTAWTLSIIRNTLIAALLVAVAGFTADFFGDERLRIILYWLAVGAFIEGFENIGIVDFRKHLLFNKDFAFMTLAKVASFMVTIALAFVWRDYWALVAGIVTGNCARVVLSYAMHEFRPVPALGAWRPILSFSKWLLVNNILTFAYNRSDTFVLGKLLGAQTVGIYTVAHEIANLANSELLLPIRRAVLPGYAKMGGDRKLLRQGFLDVFGLVLMIAGPFAVGIGLSADPLVRVVLGTKWLESIPIIEVLALYGFLAVLTAGSGAVYIAIGKPKYWTAIVGGSTALAVPLMIWWVGEIGAIGAAWALTASAAIMTVVDFSLVMHVVNLRPADPVRVGWRPAVALVLMGGGVVAIESVLPVSDAVFSQAMLLLVIVSGGAIIYMASLAGLWRLSGAPAGPERHAFIALKGGIAKLAAKRAAVFPVKSTSTIDLSDPQDSPLKILVVSWFFPPASTIAAVRIGNLVNFLIDRGHDVRAIGGKDLPYPQTLMVDLPPERITYAGWMDVNALPNAVTKFVKKLSAGRPGGDGSRKTTADRSTGSKNRATGAGIGKRLSSMYTNLFNWPDANIGWLPFALHEGRKIIRGWRPDAIFASGPPFTTLLVGKLLSILYRVPLIIEFRDRWSDDPYYPPPPWRRWVNRMSERWIARNVAAITTVSEPWAKTYRKTYGKPVAVVCNGYDDGLAYSQDEVASTPGLPLRIVYTGGIYPDRRDPSPLFEAIRNLGDLGEQVRVEFYGTDETLVTPSVSKYSVERSVSVHSPVTHRQAVGIQRQADVLLLMQWNDPKEQGNVPGKFFEYLGALRPIIVLGLEDGVPATILAERNAGFCSNDPDAIAEQLKIWIRIKSENGRIPELPASARQGFSRVEQYKIFEDFVAESIRASKR